MINPTQSPLKRQFSTLSVGSMFLAMAALLGGCNRSDSPETAGQKLDRVVASTEKAAADAERNAKASAESAEAALRETAANVKANAKIVSADLSKSVADTAITTSVSADLVKDPDLSALKIDVDVKDGVVRLYGPAPTEAAKARASVIAKSVKGVSTVENLLVVKQL